MFIEKEYRMIQHKIIGAPSKWTLSVNFFDKVDGKRRPVTFTIEWPSSHANYPVSVIIDLIQWEDGSGESWCFEGYVQDTFGKMEGISKNDKVQGWFRTSDRKGWIKVLKK